MPTQDESLQVMHYTRWHYSLLVLISLLSTTIPKTLIMEDPDLQDIYDRPFVCPLSIIPYSNHTEQLIPARRHYFLGSEIPILHWVILLHVY
jgi:hypothetical protein